MPREKIIQYMISSYNSVNEKDAELVLEEIFDKVEKNIALEEQEEKFLNQYFLNYYRYNVGGDLYPYPKYEKKLKPLYKRIADYYTIHQDKNTYESAVFLQYYYLVEMSRDYEIKPFIGIGDEEFFKKRPNACAYHTREQISQYISRPKIIYNPEYINRCVKTKQIIYLIRTGFHELEHEVQNMEIQKVKVENPQAIIWAKEDLARTVVGDIFYDKNYKQYFLERDARYYAQKRIEKILQDLGCEQYFS